MIDLVKADFGIRQTLTRFIDAVWRTDCETFADCFAEDGRWKIAGMDMTGRAEILEGAQKLLPRCDWIHVISSQPMLQVDGNAILGRLNMTEFAKLPDGSGWLTIGYYHDRYVEEGGMWRFASRHWSMKYRGPTPLDGEFAGTSNYGAFPAGPAPDEPTYVRKS